MSRAPIPLPDGWCDAAGEHGIVLVLVGHGLGLHECPPGAATHTADAVHPAALEGRLAGGAVMVSGREDAALSLDGTVSWPRRGRGTAGTAL
ncbi:MAG: hypothetical protein ACRDQ7_07525 [Haloechinothrix sp.]